MRLCSSFIPAVSLLLVLVLVSGPCAAQDPSEAPVQGHVEEELMQREALIERAQQEYRAKRFAEAERDFRELARRDPADIYMQFFVGTALFRQEKYSAAVVPYEKALVLEKAGVHLSLPQRRILIDQLAISYGESGQLKKVHELEQQAIADDPEYPLNYYNQACAFAEESNKDKMLENLSLAWQHKEGILKGEKMPDPRADSSFKKYLEDEDFVKLMREIGVE